MKLLLALLVLYFGHFSNASEHDFTARKTSKDHVKLSPEVSSQNWHTFSQSAQIDATNCDSILSWAKIKPAAHSQIVLFSLNRFLGDNQIFWFSLIPYLRSTHSSTPILVVSPAVDIFKNVADLDFAYVRFPITFTQHQHTPERIESIRRIEEHFSRFFAQNIKRDALILYDLTTLDKADAEYSRAVPDRDPPSAKFRRLLSEYEATAIGISVLQKERIFHGLAGFEFLAPSFSPTVREHPNSGKLHDKPSAPFFSSRKLIPFIEETTYGSWLENASLVFGPKTYLSWDEEYLVSPVDFNALNEFLRKNQLDLSKKFAFINLNTFGGDKVRELKALYFPIFKGLVELTLASDPNLNLLVRFPETQFGPEVQSEALDLVANYHGRVAFVPASNLHLVPVMLASAKWIVSYDSGLTHLAAFRKPNHVLTIGTQASGAELWRKPGQSYIKLTKNEPPERLLQEAQRWIRDLNSPQLDP